MNPTDRLYWYEARLAKDDDVSKYTRPVVDGDTAYFWYDKGHHQWYLDPCRLAGIDTPERGEGGFDEATEALKVKLESAEQIIIHSEELGKYGRSIGTVWVRRGDTWHNVNQEMIDEGYAEEIPK